MRDRFDPPSEGQSFASPFRLLGCGRCNDCLGATFSKCDCNAQEGCWNGGSILALASVLAVEQIFQFLLQVSRSIILFCSFERIHGRSVVFSESRQELGRCAGRVELYSSDIRGQGHCSNHVEGLGRFPGLLKRGNGSRGEILQEHH